MTIFETTPQYSKVEETKRIFDVLLYQAPQLELPKAVLEKSKDVTFDSVTDEVYFPIPFKETEAIAALKALEASIASALADLRYGRQERKIRISLERATCFAFQAYQATVGGLGKFDKEIKKALKKDTDLLQAQSDPYRRMSANLYETKNPGEFFHIHGSLDATTTLNMIGLEGRIPGLTDYEEIIKTIEPAVKKYSLEELESMNREKRQAGVTAFKFEDFAKTPHGRLNTQEPPWTVHRLTGNPPPAPFLGTSDSAKHRPLGGIKVLELCRIIAGPTVTRILGEYGADVLKITASYLSDVPFFQCDGNMGKHTADLDLKSEEGRKVFETLLADVDVFVDGYRPGAMEKLGYGPEALAKMAEKRGKGIVYVNENCFGYEGEWAGRPGWQQIADCLTGVAWAEGNFMGLSEPIVPPFPISDYGTGCMGAIGALTGLYHRATTGGSWHGKSSLMHYDLFLFAIGMYDSSVQDEMRKHLTPDVLALRHHDSVDRISGTTMKGMMQRFPHLFDKKSGEYCETWYSSAYGADVSVVKPVAEIEGLEIGFQRASRPNGWDRPTWDFGKDGDYRKDTEVHGNGKV